MVACIFIECQRCRQHTTATIRHLDHIQIALQNAVLARRTMDRDVSKIKGMFHALARKRKIILIDRTAVLGMPIHTVKHYDGDIIALFVHK